MTNYLTYFVEGARFDLPYRAKSSRGSNNGPGTWDVTFFVKTMKVDGWKRNHLRGLDPGRLNRNYGQYTQFSFAAQTHSEDSPVAEDLSRIRVRGQELVQRLVSDRLVDVRIIKASDAELRRERYELLHKSSGL